MAASPRRPLPGRIWGVLAALVILALLCLTLAFVLGSRMHSLGPERNSAREGYNQVVKPAPGDKDAEVQLAELMAGGSVTTVTATEGVPLELPNVAMVPTEVPPQAPVSTAVPLPVQTVSPLVVEPQPADTRWKANAAVTPAAQGPKLALVIDDMGGDMALSRKAVELLPEGVTLSFFPWSREGIALAHEAKMQGHEIMIHMPMEALPHGATVMDPGPDTLRVGMTPEQVETLMVRNVDRMKDIAVGLNNHMGSRFTEWEPGLRAVMTVLQREGMLFLDSKTAAPTATQAARKGLELPVLSRDVFLDHVPDAASVRAELVKAVALAKKKGFAIAIGHPLPQTVEVLAAELPRLVSEGVVLVPVTALVKP